MMLQELLFPDQVFSVQVSDSQNPEEAGLQHSRSTFFFLSAFWFMWTYSFGHEVYAFDAFSSLSCDANLYCNDFILPRCL